MVIIALKTTFQKGSYKLIVYHNMQLFEKTAFKFELLQKLEAAYSKSYLNFEDTIMNILDKLAAIKQKTLGANHKCIYLKE